MTTVQSVIIAIVEGLTEFLPVSSTAHMKITNPLIGVQIDSFEEMFEVVIQLAAILSVVTVYWKKFLDFKSAKFYIKLILALLPAIVFGVLLKKHIDSALGNLTFIACVMIGGGILLLFVDNLFNKNEFTEEEQITYPKALTIGCFQVLSIVLPGFSRSAATIVGGMSQKLTRSLAAEFSFFLAVPTMFAASAKSLLDLHKEHPAVLTDTSNLGTLAIGSIIAYVIALLSIKFFIGYLQKHGFRVFGIYRIILGSVVLALIYKGII